ncbi:hypothetical protein ACFQ0B_00700 [Nonomuraea thailandensis]
MIFDIQPTNSEDYHETYTGLPVAVPPSTRRSPTRTPARSPGA